MVGKEVWEGEPEGKDIAGPSKGAGEQSSGNALCNDLIS